MAKDIVASFDTYAEKGRGNKMDTTAITEFVCWTGLGIGKGYNYFAAAYKGSYELPQKNSRKSEATCSHHRRREHWWFLQIRVGVAALASLCYHWCIAPLFK